MRFTFLREPLDYDGSQLRSGFAAGESGGDALVAFVGACRVEGEALVDLEDRAAADSEQAWYIGEERTHQIETVGAAVKRRGWVAAHLFRKPPEIRRRDVGQVGDNQVPRRCGGRREIAEDELDLDTVALDIAPRHRQRRR